MNFLFPVFLAGLFGLLLPWVLHRFNRETPPESPFPSTRFLEATRVPISRKKRLRHLGLLSLRALFLLAACLLFAQPYCSTDKNRAGAQSNTFVVIDRSASMLAGERWSAAVDKASDALNASGSNQLADASQNPVQLFDLTSQLTAHASLSSNLTEAKAALLSLEPSYEKAQYGLMMQQLDALASKETLPVDVVFITDAQKSNLPLQRRLLRTQHIRNFSIEQVGAQEKNLAVKGSASSIDGVNAQVSAQVLFSQAADSPTQDSDPARISLQIGAGEQILSTRDIDALSNQTVTVVVDDLILPSAETTHLTVRAFTEEGDDLAVDSIVDVPLRNAQPIVVGMRAFNMKVPEAASLFLRTALSTDSLARVVSLSGNEASAATNHWIVFVPYADNEQIILPEEVTQFVQSGGNVMMVLQPGMEESAGTPTESDYIGSVDVAHPLALGELDWQEARIYSPMTLALSELDRVLMRTGQGLPYMIERSVNERVSAADSISGRLLIVADPLNGVVSDLPLQSAFVEWVAHAIQWFDASSAFPEQLNVGDSLVVPANAQVMSPSQKPLRTLAESSTSSRLSFTEPGIYTVVTGSAEHQVMVTLPWEESNLTVIDDDFKQAWTLGELAYPDSDKGGEAELNSAESANPSDAALDASVPKSEQLIRQPWWPWLLPLLALTLVAESLLANRRLAVRRDGL